MASAPPFLCSLLGVHADLTATSRAVLGPARCCMPPKRSASKPIDAARAWWKAHVDAERYVLEPADAPSPTIARLLRTERLVLEVAGRRVWILTLPTRTDDRAIFVANYWPVVARVLARYIPAAVTGFDAVRLHLEDFSLPTVLAVQHAANQSEYALSLAAEFQLRLRPGHTPHERIVYLDVPGSDRVPVLAPAALLLTLDEPEVTRGIEAVTAWLRHLVVRQPELDAALEDQPRPVVLQRLADIAGAAGNPGLARQLDAAVRRVSATRATPARTGVGDRIMVPPAVLALPRGTGTAWGDEQRMRLERQTGDIAVALAPYLADLPRFTARTLLANAQASKAYDAYHSTTMEGYRISKEMSDAIIAGAPLAGGPQDEETLRAAMAVQGYSHAFDLVLQHARGVEPITRGMILDLYEALFRPSVDAGRVEAYMLRGWRTSGVGLAGYRHVPPNPRKLHDLLTGLERYAADAAGDSVESSAVRALVLHLEFVTIHPFLDGNGRLGRLLMNLELLRAGLPWVTVRADERIPFFKAIERAQVDGDVQPFAAFLGHLIRSATTELANRPRARARR